MKQGLWIAVCAASALALTGCEPRPPRQIPATVVQTIENTPPRLAPVQPPPMLEESSMPVRPNPAIPAPGTPQPGKAGAPKKGPDPAEALAAKTNLPFTPAIAMDPVDGSKISITAETPIASHEDRWYYFTSEANRRAFLANPAQYTKGSLSNF